MTDIVERVIDVIWEVAEKHGIEIVPSSAAETMARAAIRAHEAALTDAGLVIVPREPTKEMIDVGNTVAEDAGDVWMPSEGISLGGPSCGREVYLAMIATSKDRK